MLTLEKILIPIDFSDSATLALKYGATLVLEHGSKLYLLAIVEEEKPDMVGLEDRLGVIQKWARENSEKTREQLEALSNEMLRDLDPVTIVRVGNAADEIMKVAQDEKINLIVLGAHGKSGYKKEWLGETAYHVVRKAPCPVLTVKPQQGSGFIAG
ncbi:MAG: universal stress protein [bacterium]|jgi:nucleotide-binding universal stress UspA family protein|nr:universal stress protein [bacterium]